MESLHYLLMKSQTLFSRRILDRVGALGLTSGQPKVLDFLLEQGEADQKTIAAYCEIEPATVGSILLRMENAGLVTRRQKDGNRRSLYVSLTEKGRAAAEQTAQIFLETETQALSSFTGAEAESLRAMLQTLCGALRAPSESKGEGK